MTENIEKDYYIKLINDLLDKPLTKEQINIPILQDISKVTDSTAYDINSQLINSCKAIGSELGTEDLDVGAKIGYIEPCPIGYTGSVIKGNDRFNTIFLGLNPHLEPPRPFDPSTTLADLANFHHPHDILHGKDRSRYEKNGVIKNNFFRVLGNMEGKTGRSAWSPFFKPIIRTHLALLKDNKNNQYTYKKWGDVLDLKKTLPELTDHLIDLLKKYPLAHIELIPYKSTNYTMDNFTALVTPKKPSPITEKYKQYISDVFDFINKYATEDAYIIIPTNLTGDDTIENVYEKVVQKQINVLNADCSGEYLFFSRKDKKFELPPSNKKRIPYETSPTYLAEWKSHDRKIKRKIIITASVSGQGQYNWIYTDFNNGWIDAIRDYFPSK